MYKVMNNGCKIPMVGLGCFKAGEESCVRAVETAISVGYRHFDTANHYENEKYVGQGIRNSGIDRSEVFVVSKIWPTSFHEPVKIIEFSLKALNLDYIDAYLIHWPGLDADARYRVWETLMRYKDMGYIKGVGVSNFKKAHLIDLKEKFGVAPCMNEFEISPWLQKPEDYQYCQEHNIVMSASVPFAKGDIMGDPTLQEIAKKHNKNVAQVVVRWNLQRGNCVIPKSSNPERIRSNFQVFDFALDQTDMDRIAALDREKHYGSDPFKFTGDYWHFEDAYSDGVPEKQ